MREILKCRDLCLGYGRRRVLEGASFSIREGESVALLGRNGSGKSTLVKALNRLIQPASGEVWIDSEYLEQRGVPMYTIFSEADDQIILSTVYAELALGLVQQGKGEEETHAIVERNLARFRLLPYIHDNPYFLSTGEKKKLLLATALSLEPGLLILDEPFSGLDVRSQNELAEDILSIDCAKILVTHEYARAQQCCERALVLHQGRLSARDSVADLLADSEAMADWELH